MDCDKGMSDDINNSGFEEVYADEIPAGMGYFSLPTLVVKELSYIEFSEITKEKNVKRHIRRYEKCLEEVRDDSLETLVKISELTLKVGNPSRKQFMLHKLLSTTGNFVSGPSTLICIPGTPTIKYREALETNSYMVVMGTVLEAVNKRYLFSILGPSVNQVINLSDEGEVSNPGFDIDKTLSWRFPDGERRLSQSHSQREEMLNKYNKSCYSIETLVFLPTILGQIESEIRDQLARYSRRRFTNPLSKLLDEVDDLNTCCEISSRLANWLYEKKMLDLKESDNEKDFEFYLNRLLPYRPIQSCLGILIKPSVIYPVSLVAVFDEDKSTENKPRLDEQYLPLNKLD